ncbi:B_lectin domain-containing protein/Pkinase_Tyr domain-containing protein/PAN_2 domain-containing protein/DUF3403 domain-containing protein [Cephalotus follicularis]|uniref:Receptor-like serine/threonine-protein kinase n=1 Tax=Cephalotus follicularis TaxID=3775 RepID=A0A1Q3DBG4_CEPFO|nr:B_lectin domain-containing protein/Pkinase_Tyr domain-containing protein/PAN_2 domain-containing protein/DUF3403 domain-containing protein [Cephalotus follicularis]
MAEKHMYKIIHFLFFCFCASHVAAVNNTLNQGNKLNFSTDTLVSNNGLFTLGFYSSGDPNISYFGILYKDSIYKGKPFWIANLDKPMANNTASLTLDTTGNLILSDASQDSVTLYSAQSTTNLAAVLEDSGNFVLQQVTTSGSTAQILWQSFDYPTDSYLPGMKLGVNYKTGTNWSLTSWLTDSFPTPGAFTLDWDPDIRELVLRRRGVIFWTSGQLLNNGTFEYTTFLAGSTQLDFIFNNVSDVDEAYLMYSVVTNEYTPADTLNFSMWTLEYDGSILDQYDSLYVLGPNLCDGSNTAFGCKRWEGSCRGKGDKFAVRSGGFDNPVPRNVYDNVSLTISDCKDMCWKDCKCVAATFGNSNRTGCTLFYGPFSQDLTGASVTYFVIVNDSPSPGRTNWIWIPIAIVLALAAILLGILLYLRRRKIQQKEKFLRELMTSDRPSDANELKNDGNMGHNLNIYSVVTIMEATNSFAIRNKLGEGGFGPVYKGILADGQEIAVKRLSRRSGQGLVEFKNELILIAKLQHTNLVRLLGCCIHGEEKMLVYEYMPNKSLDSIIFDESKKGLLNWGKRYSIIEGIAQGLLYLHKYSRLKIIHRDLKVSNILLDENLNPKISDFGMARIFNTNDMEVNTIRVVGTYGYMSPEYAMEGVFSVKSDVFSFGVLVLEIVSGRKNHSLFQLDRPIILVAYAWELWKEDRAIELLDPTLRDSYSKDQVLRCINVGLLCVEESASDRPAMPEVVSMLTSEATQLPPPKQPAFSTARSTKDTSFSEIRTENSSTNEVSISVLNAR